MDQLAATSLARRRFVMQLLGFFAITALLLSAVGLYGIMTQFVISRVKELGIRMALGASSRAVLRLILGNGLGLSLAGAVLGTGGALAASRLLANQLYRVKTYDPVTFVIVIVMLGGVAVIAALVPALNAIRIDPLRALRHE